MRLTPLLLIALLAPALAANAQPNLDDIRDQLKNSVRNSDVGAGYAQMLNFFAEPDISASRLSADDVDYDIFKIPLQFEIPLADSDWQIALRGTLSHARADSDSELPPFGTVASEWQADSGQLGAGLIMPFSTHWSAFVAAEFGISRLQNEADYLDEFGQDLLPAIADGIIFNWDTNARISGITGGLGYTTKLADKYDLNINGRYTFSHIASYSESRDLPSFSENTGTFSLKADLIHPYGVSIAELPVFGKVHLGGTAFTGNNRNALGFTHFYEVGYSVGLDISQLGYKVKSLSVGYQWNQGSDVDGYSVLLSWELM
ncbi:MAG: Solitary outer membrane autotransporter beta-barrel domain [Halioglobus sp.]